MVHDPWSAETLGRALRGEIKGSWTTQVEERPDEPEPKAPKPSRRASAQTLPAGPADSVDTNGGSPARRSKRYKVRLWVVMVTGTRNFASATRDVSAGGLALEEKIPDFMFGQYCRIYVYRSLDGERIDLKCRIFADPRNPRRLQFVDPPEEALARLKQWAEALEAAEDKTEVA